MTCCKGKNCSSNVTTIPRIRWFLYSKLECEFYKFPPTPAALKGNLRPKFHSCIYDIILMNLWKKSLVQSFESGVSDVILANVENTSPQVIFFRHSFMIVLTTSQELMKLPSFE